MERMDTLNNFNVMPGLAGPFYVPLILPSYNCASRMIYYVLMFEFFF